MVDRVSFDERSFVDDRLLAVDNSSDEFCQRAVIDKTGNSIETYCKTTRPNDASAGRDSSTMRNYSCSTHIDENDINYTEDNGSFQDYQQTAKTTKLLEELASLGPPQPIIEQLSLIANDNHVLFPNAI